MKRKVLDFSIFLLHSITDLFYPLGSDGVAITDFPIRPSIGVGIAKFIDFPVSFSEVVVCHCRHNIIVLKSCQGVSLASNVSNYISGHQQN